jgi:hypothetical protein
MTTLAVPPSTIAATTHPAEPATSLPRQRSTTVHAVMSSARSQPSHPPAPTGRLLPPRDHLPADDPDPDTSGIAAASGPLTRNPPPAVGRYASATRSLWTATGWSHISGPAGWPTCSTPSHPPAGR